MKRNISFVLLLVIAGFPFLSSCDDETPKPANITFETATLDITESDATLKSFHPLIGAALRIQTTGREIEFKVLLDRPASQTAVVNYTIGGSATKNSSSVIGDFEIEGSTLTIEKGATEAIMKIKLFEDFALEDAELNDDGIPFETIIITLESVLSGPAKIGAGNTFIINVLEDDLEIDLKWDSHQNTQAGNVDMDLFIWLEDDQGYYLIRSSRQGLGKFETLNVPAALPDGAYAFSYTYYSGTSDDVDLTVDFHNNAGKLNGGGSSLQFTADRNLSNINKYDEEASPDFKGDPVIVQTAEKKGFNYINMSPIGTPLAGTGSRISSKMNPEMNYSLFRNLKAGLKTLPLK